MPKGLQCEDCGAGVEVVHRGTDEDADGKIELWEPGECTNSQCGRSRKARFA